MKKRPQQRSALESDSEEESQELYHPDHQGEPPEGLDGSNSGGGKKTRGRPKVPEEWTRVISFEDDDLDELRVYELKLDLLLGNAMSKIETRGKASKAWKPLFWPDDFAKEHKNMKLEDFALQEE